MNSDPIKERGLKHKVTHELREFVWIFLYLALFLCALSTYSMLLLDEFQVKYFAFGAALVNALALSHVILLGERKRLGKKHEGKPLIFSAVYKAFLFGLLAAAFHVLEEVIKRLLHGQDLARAFHELRLDDVLVRNLVVFCGFIPFFAFRELRRVLGEGKFFDLFFRTGAIAVSELSSGIQEA